jgi:CHAT domain-containing protein
MGDILYRLDWDSGRTTQLDVLNTAEPPAVNYKLHYTPPIRSTISSPLLDLENLDEEKLRDIERQMEIVATLFRIDGLDRSGGGAEPPLQPDPTAMRELKRLAHRLYDALVNRAVQADIQRYSGLFLNLGIDEKLLEYPWELMHDRNEYLCLKHRIGRIVNSASLTIPTSNFEWLGDKRFPLRILLIAVPTTEQHEGDNYHDLPQAQVEADTLMNLLKDNEAELGVKVEARVGERATYEEIETILNETVDYQIVHFCGHADFDEDNPKKSRLILFNRAMPVADIVNKVSRVRPIFCFINGCETGQMGPARGGQVEVPKKGFRLHGLGRAFLETGAYLLGTRWKVSDDAAAHFAESFYKSLLVQQLPLGEAMRGAREHCKAKLEESRSLDLGWASYVFYGDPRVGFKR